MHLHRPLPAPAGEQREPGGHRFSLEHPPAGRRNLAPAARHHEAFDVGLGNVVRVIDLQQGQAGRVDLADAPVPAQDADHVLVRLQQPPQHLLLIVQPGTQGAQLGNVDQRPHHPQAAIPTAARALPAVAHPAVACLLAVNAVFAGLAPADSQPMPAPQEQVPVVGMDALQPTVGRKEGGRIQARQFTEIVADPIEFDPAGLRIQQPLEQDRLAGIHGLLETVR